jgi:hypothetical protein
MNSTKPISDQSLPAEPAFAEAQAELAPVGNLVGLKPSACRVQIDRLVRKIESSSVREIVGNVFQDLLRLLECLDLTESHLRQVDAAHETFELFQLIHDEARRLVDYIRTDVLSCEGMSEELVDTLDGITFAVSHDLQRVFETNSKGPNAEKRAHVMVGKLYRAHDILTNCLQQSTVTLALLFDPNLSGARLFNNSDMRYRQSLQLCQDLSELINLLEKAEETLSDSALSALNDGIEEFRNESMEFLMYSDWPQFESFCERVKFSNTQSPELQSFLHQFRCYLETLLGQVRMRAVLANDFPVRFDDHGQPPATTGDNSAPSSTSFDSQGEGAAWDAFAFAV